MRIPAVLLLLLVGFPALEIVLFIEVGQRIGAWPTVGVTLAAMVVGALLIRYQGILTLVRVREAFLRGEAPAMALLEGVALLVSGFLFLLPGFFSDLLALILFLPFLRRPLIRRLLRRLRPPRNGGGSTTIEGEFRREEDPRLH